MIFPKQRPRISPMLTLKTQCATTIFGRRTMVSPRAQVVNASLTLQSGGQLQVNGLQGRIYDIECGVSLLLLREL